MSYDLGLCGTPMSGICYFIAEQYWEVSVQTTASGTTLSKTLLDCNGMEGSSSVSSQGHWTMEAWVMNWVIWDIYEWCLLCHGGAVLRGGRKPIAALPNVAVQTAWWLPSSTSGSMTGPQWNRRSFFHFHHWVIWTDEAWVWSWVIWEIYVLYLLFLCEAVLRGMGDIYSWFCHIIAELYWVEPPPPGVAQYDLDHCHVGDYNLGSCGTSMRDICYFFAEQYWEAWGNFWKRSVSLLLGVLFVFGFCLLCGALFGFCLVIVTPWLLSHLLKATI